MMAPPARVGVRDLLKISHKEIIEGLHDIICHAHELAIRGGQAGALHNEVTYGLHSVMQAKRKRCRAVKDCRGERFSSDKLCHDIDKRKSEVAQILPGLLRSKEDAELTLQPLVIEIGELAIPGGVNLRATQL
jgi:hypothetical protein